ncbi:formiminoglutamate deiminase [Nocardioides zeae]|uniref:Formiminoglutamate deiminase n=1 Tax=Nocardioides zeae TaxID=1457234 RepID=A0ACC6IJF8_9ACTN|nr:formimidoylglutamate deiminase [Nocardioides zeae]MDR6174736.1 formiminoglutamate deiminase [Nocardioides zeae]MDR6210805.1 formiminoglutamate deiminase [Nocardioides zeae]
MTTTYRLERAWLALPGQAPRVHDDVVVRVERGRFTEVRPAGGPEDALAAGAVRLAGLTLPGLADTHSHLFHRALRGRVQRGGGSFWTWRDDMYGLAARLDPASYRVLARAVLTEMLAAGFTGVGEFHYVHHRPDGTPYDAADGGPHAMALAVVDAAAEVGMRVTLLDTCYLAAGFGRPTEGVQKRFDDGSAAAWLRRHADLRTVLADRLDEDGGVRLGAALHSVRAVPPTALAELAAAGVGGGAEPLHVHLSEQVAENDQCRAATGLTPTGLLARHGMLGPMTSLVHATHLTPADVGTIGSAGAHVAFCPTTERDLGDGIGPARALVDAGARLTLGSDSHAVVDPFEEMRAVEMHERLAAQRRGHFTAAELLASATVDGHASLGVHDAGRIAAGARADLVTLDTATPRTAGTGADEHTAVFAATAADVVHVVADGRVVHRASDAPAVGALLAGAIEAVRA